MNYNKLQSLAANVTAIETAVAIKAQGRKATEDEKRILALYSGFGGIKEVLNIGTEVPIPGDMAEQMNRLLEALKILADRDETAYKAMTDSIKASVLTAFYTPNLLIEIIAGQIHTTFRENGLQMRSFLEPSAGIGGFLPVAMDGTRSYTFVSFRRSGCRHAEERPQSIHRGYARLGERGCYGTYWLSHHNVLSYCHLFSARNLFNKKVKKYGNV